MKTDNSNNKYRFYASMGTIVFHSLIILLLLFTFITTPIPPYPEAGGGGGLEVNLGYMDEGTGEIQPEISNQKPEPYDNKVIPDKTQNVGKENILTNENGEEVNIKTDNKNLEKEKITDHNKTEIKINDPVVNPNSLFKKFKGGGSEGGTGNPGDQGNPDGTLYSKNHSGTGTGDGSGEGPGSGGGKDGGSGTGTGKGKGAGIDYVLKDRTHVYLEKPIDKSQKEGTVVVEIKVNSNGEVIYANPGVKGSTTLDSYLLKIAAEAARKTKFNKKPNSPDQIGTIKYHFVLQ